MTVGYSDASLLGRIALATADARGYFADAGFQGVTFMRLDAPLPGLLNGSLDFAILDTAEASRGFSLGLPLRAIAGHRIGVTPTAPTASPLPGSSPLVSAAPATPSPAIPTVSASPAIDQETDKRDVLATTTDMTVEHPDTVTAFTAAYIRALVDIRTRLDAGTTEPAPSPGVDALLQLATDAGIEIPDALRAAWPEPLVELSPDGGFAALSDDAGLGAFRSSLSSDTIVLDGPDGFLWTDGLHAAQRWLGLPENPSASASPLPSVDPSALPSAGASVAP